MDALLSHGFVIKLYQTGNITQKICPTCYLDVVVDLSVQATVWSVTTSTSAYLEDHVATQFIISNIMKRGNITLFFSVTRNDSALLKLDSLDAELRVHMLFLL